MAGVWAVIASLVPASELPELARAVGEERMEKCGDLRAEADALREIVEGYASENAAPLDDGADAAGEAPSAEKDARVRRYLASKRTRARGARVVRRRRRGRQRPGTADKAPTRRKEVEALRKSLNVETFDEVLAEVRSLLDAEAEDLLREIDDLTATFDRVDEAVVERAQGGAPRPSDGAPAPPSLPELREIGKLLEERWLAIEHRRDVKGVLARAKRPPGAPASPQVVASPVTDLAKFSKTGPIERKSDARDKQGNPRMFSRTLTAPMPAPPAMGPLQPPPRKSKLRARMQNAREEQFLNDW
ncbi:hypothetical protein JL720_9440 [Aureococcus anophagefferens]|nr:hypothetical protein JL720_9440 [Aureococcus anophagefferens]